MLGGKPIYPSYSLNQANGIPMQIVVDDVAAILEVLAFTEDVRGNED